MKTEIHTGHLVGTIKDGLLPDAIYNICCYPDWTFAQAPITLFDRFAGLKKNSRVSPEVLDALEQCGNNFEAALKQIISPNIWQEMTTAGPYKWETQMRKAYCAPSGLTIQEVFPQYVQ